MSASKHGNFNGAMERYVTVASSKPALELTAPCQTEHTQCQLLKRQFQRGIGVDCWIGLLDTVGFLRKLTDSAVLPLMVQPWACRAPPRT
eukprot:1608097-Prymnesium_polylepis.1